MYFLIFFAQILFFYLTSKRVTQAIYQIIRKLLSEKLTIWAFSIVFLPGTFLHEISHYLTARFLLVKTDGLSLKPVQEGDGIQMGSVSIEKTDPIRRFLIGIAPLFLGLIIVLSLSYTMSLQIVYWQKILIGFLIFIISNSMFSSSKDMEGAFKLFIVSSVVVFTAYFLGIDLKIGIESLSFEKIDLVFKSASQWFIIPIFINLVVVTLFKVLR